MALGCQVSNRRVWLISLWFVSSGDAPTQPVQTPVLLCWDTIDGTKLAEAKENPSKSDKETRLNIFSFRTPAAHNFVTLTSSAPDIYWVMIDMFLPVNNLLFWLVQILNRAAHLAAPGQRCNHCLGRRCTQLNPQNPAETCQLSDFWTLTNRQARSTNQQPNGIVLTWVSWFYFHHHQSTGFHINIFRSTSNGSKKRQRANLFFIASPSLCWLDKYLKVDRSG